MIAQATLTAIAALAALLAGLPLAVFSVELLAGLVPLRRSAASGTGAVNTAILIPAHNEGSGIAATLAELNAIAPTGTRIVVVADNCDDQTAAIARASGAEVIERHDARLRGKGYALAFGRDHLAASGNPPEALLVLDADCRLLAGSVEALAQAALAGGTPVQAINLISADLSAAPMVQISSFAMVVKNLYRSRGMQRLGGAALLTGTGMAFPWPLFAAANLATGSIVEDLALGIALTRAGKPPRLIEAAGVRSAPAGIDVALVQRRRWEQGFMGTLRRSALPVLAGGLRRGSLAEILLGLHLLVPPLALVLALAGAMLVGVSGLALLGASWLPAVLLGAVLAAALLLVLAAWLAGGREFLSGAALLRAPLYVLWKLPMYLGFVRKPQPEWQRTPRKGD